MRNEKVMGEEREGREWGGGGRGGGGAMWQPMRVIEPP
jgi:hypothetical protein